MKIWFDVLSPKQLSLFTSVARRLQGLGCKVWITSRRYVQLNGLIENAFRDWGVIRVRSGAEED